jgi:hypothetical protein
MDIMNKAEITRLVKDEVNKFVSDSLDGEIKKRIKKSGSETRTELMDTISNAVEAVFKVLWQKRQFWKSDIK